MRDRREFDVVNGDEFVARGVQRLTNVSFPGGSLQGSRMWRASALPSTIELVPAAGPAAMSRREPSLGIRSARGVGGLLLTADGRSKFRISDSPTRFEGSSCTSIIFGIAFAG